MAEEKYELKYGNEKIIIEDEPIDQFIEDNDLEKTIEIGPINSEEYLSKTSIDIFGEKYE